MTDDSPQQRQANAIGAAKEYHRLARESLDLHLTPDRAAVQALLGILRLQIEYFEQLDDIPCDCFGQLPEADREKMIGW